MKKYMLEKINKDINGNKFNAGSKARVDIAEILKNENFEEYIIELDDEGKKNILKEYLKIGKKIDGIEENSIVLVQLPISSRKIQLKMTKILKNKNCTLIGLIHDIDSLRFKWQNDKIDVEIGVYNSFDTIICHNNSMKKWLEDNGMIKPIISLDIFDYLANIEKKSEVFDDKVINFAGNLAKEKSGFLYKLKNINMDLYGANLSEEPLDESINYLGKKLPEELPVILNKGYGLIWDGDSLEGCKGEMGEYLKFNNPHKLSLYMASGIPVVTWSKAAISEFITKNKVGFTIDTLEELNEKLEENKELYKEYLENAKKVQSKVLGGEFTKEALLKALDIVK